MVGQRRFQPSEPAEGQGTPFLFEGALLLSMQSDSATTLASFADDFA